MGSCPGSTGSRLCALGRDKHGFPLFLMLVLLIFGYLMQGFFGIKGQPGLQILVAGWFVCFITVHRKISQAD